MRTADTPAYRQYGDWKILHKWVYARTRQRLTHSLHINTVSGSIILVRTKPSQGAAAEHTSENPWSPFADDALRDKAKAQEGHAAEGDRLDLAMFTSTKGHKN